MSKQHTRGHLKVAADGFHVLDDGGTVVALAASVRQNASRLVACWNACEAIDTEDLEAASVAIIHKLHDEASKRVLAQRDELLGALRDLEAMVERYRQPGYPIPAAQKAARAAIAKATGAA
jgi:hypothetical protein